MEKEHKLVLDLLKLLSGRVSPPDQLFTLASGAKSRFYIDVKKTALHSRAHAPLATLLHDALYPEIFGEVQAVAGVALGGCHLASIVGLMANMLAPPSVYDVIYVRKQAKDHGTKNLVEAPTMRPGSRVVLIEDVVTTGGSSLDAAKALQGAGFEVAGILAVIDRRETPSNELEGFVFRSLYTLADFQDTLESAMTPALEAPSV
jgi:orotate phosphoribosyltransferase